MQTQTSETNEKKAKKVKKNEATDATDVGNGATAATAAPTAPEKTPEEQATAEAEAKAKAFARWLHTLSVERFNALVLGDAGLVRYFEHVKSQDDAKLQSFNARMAELRAEAKALGIELPGAAPKAVTKTRKPRAAKGGAPTVDTATVERVYSDIVAHPGSKAKDVQERLQIDAKTWDACKIALDGRIVQKGQRGPYVTYSSAV